MDVYFTLLYFIREDHLFRQLSEKKHFENEDRQRDRQNDKHTDKTRRLTIISLKAELSRTNKLNFSVSLGI